jgi:chemotaxis protein histidine kinase CheA
MMSEKKNTSQVIEIPNPLRDKVPYDDSGVDVQQLKQAEEAVAALAETYLSWASRDIQSIRKVSAKVRAEANWQSENVKQLFLLTHDLKGQGGTFGYNLLSLIGDKLCRFIEESSSKKKMSTLDAQVIDLHVRALEIILNDDLKSDGGEEGAMLLKGLEDVLQKALKSGQ